MIYVGLLGLMIIVSALTKNGKKLYQRRIQCAVIFTAMLLIMGLRHPSYGGVDTIVYVRDYKRLCTYNSISQVFSGFYKDYGFYLISWLFSRVCKDAQVWLFFCAIPYLFAVSRFIYRRSENVFLSFFMFLTFDYYMYNFQLMRHVFSIALCVFAFENLLDKEYKKFVIWTLIAATFHPFALALLTAIVLQKSGVGAKQILMIVAGSLAIIVLMKTSLLSTFVGLISSEGRFESFAHRGGGTLSNFFIHLLLALSAWIMLYGTKRISLIEEYSMPEKKKENRSGLMKMRYRHNCKFICHDIDYGLMMNMAIVSVVLYLGQIGVGESYRVAQYFSIFTLVFIPNVYSRYKEKRFVMILISMIMLFGIRHFFGGVFLEGSAYNPYVFFWE